MVQGRGVAMSTRYTGGAMNMERREGRGEVRKNFWSQRVMDPWNNLSNEVKTASSLDNFKNAIDNSRCRSAGNQ